MGSCKQAGGGGGGGGGDAKDVQLQLYTNQQ